MVADWSLRCALTAAFCTVGSAPPGAHAPQASPVVRPVVMVSDTGEIIEQCGRDVAASVQFGIRAVDWGAGFVSQDRVREMKARSEGNVRIIDGSVAVPGSGGKRFVFHQEVTERSDRELRILYKFSFPDRVSICGCQVAIRWQIRPFVGKEIATWGERPRKFTVAQAVGEPFLMIDSARGVEVGRGVPEGLSMECDQEMDFLLQDNRAWGGQEMEARFRLMENEQPVVVSASTVMEHAFTLRFNRPMRMVLNAAAPDSNDTSGWMPYAANIDAPPVDLSVLNDRPAGRRGRVLARKGGLEFADGTPARFWGMALDGAACFPPAAEADRSARHLSALGANLVRLRGFLPLLANEGVLDEARLAALDHLVHRLKQEGIFLCIDVPVGGVHPPAPAAVAAFWKHVNPHTKLAYGADACVALAQITTESSVFGEPLGDTPAEKALAAEAKLCTDAAASLRAAGFKGLIGGSAWGESLAQTAALLGLDAICGHGYWDQPHGRLAGSAGWPLASAPSGWLYASMVSTRAAGKPYLGMSIDCLWNMDLRAEPPLSLAALACLQGWDGVISHAYRRSAGGEAASLKPGESWNDPAVAGLAPHAALLVRRGDASPARRAITVAAGGSEAATRANQGPWEHPVFTGTSEVYRVRVDFDAANGTEGTSSLDDRPLPESSADLVSDTGQLIRSLTSACGTIDTPRTQAAYGSIGGREVELSDLRIRPETPYAVIALSSLTQAPIRQSGRALLTAVGRAENAGTRYNVLHSERLADGTAPLLVEPIEGEVSIRLARKLTVVPVKADGTRGPALETNFRDGRMTFRIGAAHRAVHYLLGN